MTTVGQNGERNVAPRAAALDGAAVRRLRLERKLSQKALARQAGVHEDTIARAEAGRPINLDNAEAMARALGVKPAALSGHSGEPLSQAVDDGPAQTNIPEGMVPRVFRGREADLAEVDRALAGGGGRVAITALHGLRGVGKTVLAAAYAERHRADYRALWWVRAETEATLRADLVGLAVRLGWAAPDEQEEPALAAVRERLPSEGDGVLLVFDNARDVEALRPWLPLGGTCRVIVTANAPNWGAIATPVAIQTWPKETGGDFLLERTRRPDRERAAAVALPEALGGLPLAHEMAAAYCERTGLSFAGYRARFKAQAPYLLDSGRDAPPGYHPEFYEEHRDRLTVAKAFALAIDAAARANPAAETMITHAALLAPEPIPRFFFAEGFDLFADDVLDEAVAALREFGLVDCEAIPDERDPTSLTETIRLHRLVREVAASRISGEAREAAQTALIGAMSSVYPDNPYDNPRTWPRARCLDPLALTLVGVDAEVPSGAEAAAGHVMNELALYKQYVLGAYAQAEPLLRRALAIDEATLKPDHPNVAAALNNLAGLLRDTNRPGEAEPLYRRALAIDEASRGPDHPTVAIRLNNLAALLSDTNRPGEAEPLCRRALAITEARLGPDHPTVANRLNNFALLLRDTNRPGEAEPFLRRALAIFEKSLGPDHSSTVTVRGNLAALLSEGGKP